MVHLMIPILNIKVKVMKIHQSSNIMKRLDHIWVTRLINLKNQANGKFNQQ